MEERWMLEALFEAHKAYQRDEVPIGAIIVKDGQVIARAHNLKEKHQISTHHAEILCIEKACKELKSWRLEDCELYVTLEPCPMCAGAIYQSRIKKVVFGASDPKGGAYGSIFDLNEQPGLNHYPEVVGGVLSEECGLLLSQYFKEKRETKNQI